MRYSTIMYMRQKKGDNIVFDNFFYWIFVNKWFHQYLVGISILYDIYKPMYDKRYFNRHVKNNRKMHILAAILDAILELVDEHTIFS